MGKVYEKVLEYTEDSELETIPIPTNCQVKLQEKPYYAYPMRYIPWDPDMAQIKGQTELASYNGLYQSSTSVTESNIASIESITPPYCESSEKLKDINKSLPNWNNGYILSPLREGWLLVRRQYQNEDEPTWFEYKVMPDGSLKNILWTDEEVGSDIRYQNKQRVSCLSFSRRAEYYVLFTEIQISWNMYKELEDDTSLRNKLMQKIVPADMENCEAMVKLKDSQLLNNGDIYDEEVSSDTYIRRLEDNNYILGIVDIMGTADFLQSYYEEKLDQMRDLLAS